MLTPSIVMTGGPAAIEFHNETFGAQQNSRLMSPDGKEHYAGMAPCFFRE